MPWFKKAKIKYSSPIHVASLAKTDSGSSMYSLGCKIRIFMPLPLVGDHINYLNCRSIKESQIIISLPENFCNKSAFVFSTTRLLVSSACIGSLFANSSRMRIADVDAPIKLSRCQFYRTRMTPLDRTYRLDCDRLRFCAVISLAMEMIRFR